MGIDLRMHPGRQYAPPTKGWSVHMVWHDLLFMHWKVRPAQLREHIPPGLDIETHDGWAWLGVVPFGMRDVRHRSLPPIPGTAAFPELNVRTYVSAPGPDGLPRPGVFFFSLDVPKLTVALTARTTFSLGYMTARMAMRRTGGGIEYESVRAAPLRNLTWGPTMTFDARFRAVYAPTGDARHAESGTLEHFLTDRYCLYSVTRSGRLYRAEIHHERWPLRPARASVEVNTMTEPLGILSDALDHEGPPLLHFADHLEVVAWLPEPVAAPVRSGEVPTEAAPA